MSSIYLCHHGHILKDPNVTRFRNHHQQQQQEKEEEEEEEAELLLSHTAAMATALTLRWRVDCTNGIGPLVLLIRYAQAHLCTHVLGSDTQTHTQNANTRHYWPSFVAAISTTLPQRVPATAID